MAWIMQEVWMERNAEYGMLMFYKCINMHECYTDSYVNLHEKMHNSWSKVIVMIRDFKFLPNCVGW